MQRFERDRGLPTTLGIPKSPWGRCELQEMEVQPKLFLFSSFLTPNTFLSTFLTTCTQHIPLGHPGNAVLMVAVIATHPSAITNNVSKSLPLSYVNETFGAMNRCK